MSITVEAAPTTAVERLRELARMEPLLKEGVLRAGFELDHFQFLAPGDRTVRVTHHHSRFPVRYGWMLSLLQVAAALDTVGLRVEHRDHELTVLGIREGV